jgi:hypothetical protein
MKRLSINNWRVLSDIISVDGAMGLLTPSQRLQSLMILLHLMVTNADTVNKLGVVLNLRHISMWPPMTLCASNDKITLTLLHS